MYIVYINNDTNTQESVMKARQIVNNEILLSISDIIDIIKPEYADELLGVIYVNDEELIEDSELEYEETEEYREVFGYFLVTDWMARRLRAYGEYVAEIKSWNVWHRTTCGQLIESDFVIKKIADDLKFI